MRLRGLLVFMFFCSGLCALEVSINYGKENSQNFSVLNLQHDEPFECQELSNAQGAVTRIVCVINKLPLASFSPTNTIFFKFWNRVNEGKFYLYIEPNFSAKLFNTFIDLKTNTPIPKERPRKSKSWQIVGFKDTIPFLSRAQSRGLNFPIAITHENEDFVSELDVDRAPLVFEEGQDFSYYLSVQDLMRNGLYVEAIKTIDETLYAFPNSIFVKDLLFFRLKALQILDSEDNADSVIEMGLKWVKRYPTDINVPEVLYYIGNAYTHIRFSSEAKYFYDRLISEYPQSRFAPLAKMQIAKGYYGVSESSDAMRYFAQGYQEAKDLDSASEIALEWSSFYLQTAKKDEAKALIDTLLKANPAYFGQNVEKSVAFVNLLMENEIWQSAAQISENIYSALGDERVNLKEDLLNKASLSYQNGGDFEKAHAINARFLEEFTHRPRAEEIKERDDKLLFEIGVNDTPEEKIKRYDYLMQTYPNTEIAQKAQELKNQILFSQKRFNEILNTDTTSALAQQSYIEILNTAIANKDCQTIARNFAHYTKESFNNTQRAQIFDCLYSLSLNKQAQEVIEGLAKEENGAHKKLNLLYLEALNLDKLALSKPASIASRDALTLAQSLKAQEYYDIGFTLFRNLLLNANMNEAREVATFLHQNLGDDIRMIDIDLELLKLAQDSKDETTLQLYANDILRLQSLHNTTQGTPYVDFALIQSFMRERDFAQSLKIVDSLLTKEITPNTRAQALYLKGSVLRSLNNNANARKSFEECKATQGDSQTWQSLCAQALDLVQ